jgi:hypothetical protein
MRQYPQKWSVLRENPPLYDESTGNKIPVPPTPVEVRGLLSLRFLETKQDEHSGDMTTSQMVLQLNAPIPGGLNGRDRLRFDGDTRTDGVDATGIVEIGQVVYVRGRPKERRSAAGGPVQYVVAIVEHGSDMASNPTVTP